MRSLPVWVEQATMLTCWSDSELDTSRRSRERSKAFTSTAATNTFNTNKMQWDIGHWHQARFNTTRCTQPINLCATCTQLIGNG